MTMETKRKLSLKRVEISLTKFNDVAIPHHLDLLRQHKMNIIRYQECGDLNRVRNEQINAKRLVTQIKSLLSEMEVLREQVIERDLPKFDKITQHSRKKMLQAIMEYLDCPPHSVEIPTSTETSTNEIPVNIKSSSSTESIGTLLTNCPPHSVEIPTSTQTSTNEIPVSIKSSSSTESIGTLLTSNNIQLVHDNIEEETRLREQEACAASWEELNREVQELFDVFVKFQRVIDEQKAPVDIVESNVVSTAINVDEGRKSLARAERYKLTLYPIAGAVLGGCILGPIGLIAGVKVASAALIGGGVLGFTGGSMLKKRANEQDLIQLQSIDKEKDS